MSEDRVKESEGPAKAVLMPGKIGHEDDAYRVDVCGEGIGVICEPGWSAAVVANNINNALASHGWAGPWFIEDDLGRPHPATENRISGLLSELTKQRDEWKEKAILHGRLYDQAFDQIRKCQQDAERLAGALSGVMQAAQFGSNEQSPPGCWDDRIELAKEALKGHDSLKGERGG